MGPITGQTAIVTGASRGIGLEFVKQLAGKGNRVIAACRTPEKSPVLQGIENVEVTKLDVSDPASISAWADDIGKLTNHVDLLINNAGIYGKRVGLKEMDIDTMLEVFTTNACGPFLVAQQLHKRSLLGGSKHTLIANISSKMGSVDDNGSGGSYAYRASKSALNNISKSLSIDLAQDNVQCVCLHPGWVITDMVNNNGLIRTETSVAGMLNVLETQELDANVWRAWDNKIVPW